MKTQLSILTFCCLSLIVNSALAKEGSAIQNQKSPSNFSLKSSILLDDNDPSADTCFVKLYQRISRFQPLQAGTWQIGLSYGQFVERVAVAYPNPEYNFHIYRNGEVIYGPQGVRSYNHISQSGNLDLLYHSSSSRFYQLQLGAVISNEWNPVAAKRSLSNAFLAISSGRRLSGLGYRNLLDFSAGLSIAYDPRLAHDNLFQGEVRTASPDDTLAYAYTKVSQKNQVIPGVFFTLSKQLELGNNVWFSCSYKFQFGLLKTRVVEQYSSLSAIPVIHRTASESHFISTRRITGHVFNFGLVYTIPPKD